MEEGKREETLKAMTFIVVAVSAAEAAVVSAFVSAVVAAAVVAVVAAAVVAVAAKIVAPVAVTFVVWASAVMVSDIVLCGDGRKGEQKTFKTPFCF